jgi:PKD repeat protein
MYLKSTSFAWRNELRPAKSAFKLMMTTLALMLILGVGKISAQVANMNFSSGFGTYTPITGGATVGTATSDDESFVNPAAPAGATGAVTGPGLPIGFNFDYNGATFDRFGINANGWIFLGQSALTPSVANGANSYTPLSATTTTTPAVLRNRIAPFARDLQAQATAEIRYETLGSAPNRVLVVQWTNYARWTSAPPTGDTINFQIRLHEGSNAIHFVYGRVLVTAATTVEVGLGGTTNADFNNRSIASDWTSSLRGTVNSATSAIGPAANIPNGLTFVFENNTCFSPQAITSTAVTNNSLSFRWSRQNNVAVSGYQFAVTTSSTPPASGTATTDTFATVGSLLPTTNYFVHVRTNCGTGFSSWTTQRIATAGPMSSVASGLWSSPSTWSSGSVPSSASDVTISAGDSVILDVTGQVASLTVNGILAVNASVQRILTVLGATNVSASGRINFGVPTAGTSIRVLEMRGAFNHAGNSNFANGNVAWQFTGTTAQTINQTGTLAGNAVGQIQVSNLAGVTLANPITVGFDVGLFNGTFNIGNNLTIDNAAVTATSSQVRRSPLSSFAGTPTINSTVYNLQYLLFVGQTPALINEGTEMPASRTINALTVNNPSGINLTGNLTLTAATSALVLTNGIVHLPVGGKITTTNTGFNPPVGSATSFVNGSFEIVANTTTATSRNFPVGSIVNGVPSRTQVVLANIITGGSAQNITVSVTGAPGGAVSAPLTSVMGPRGIRIASTGSLGTTTTVTMNWDLIDAVQFAGSLANIRIAQGGSLTGPWTARSATVATGSLTGTGSRVTTAVDVTNGEFFAWSTVGANDLIVTHLAGPSSGQCFGQSETAVVVVRNDGPSIDRSVLPLTFRGTVTTPSGTIINLTNIVRNAGTFLSGTTDTLVFTDALNLVDTGNYVFRIFADSLAGSIRTNDTLVRTVRSDAWTARANPAQIVVSQASSVELLRNGVPAASAGTFARNQALVRFSEMIGFRTGVGAQPVYPSYIPFEAQDFLEITNFGDTLADLSGWNLEIFGAGARAYTFPANTTLPAGQVLVLHIGPGTDNPANRYYNTGGGFDAISATATWGVTLRNGAVLVDAVAFRGFTFPAAAAVTAADWSGNSSTTSSAGMMLVNFDNNNAANWVISSATLFTNLGAFNPNMSFAQRSVSWTGPGGFTASSFSAPVGVRNTAGTEVYNVTITGANACVRSASANLQVVQPVTPIAGFSVSSANATTGAIISTVTLTDTSRNIPFQRRWTITPNTFNYVNNTNDSSVSPQVQFTAVGNYTVKLVVSNPAGSDSLTRTNAIAVALGYCASNATNSNDTKIDSVIIGNTITGSASATCETYTDHTGLGVAATIVKGNGFPISVRSGYCGTSSFANTRGRVFVDANKNGFFEANEVVGEFGPLTATGSGAPREWFNFQIFVPGTADTGITRMRIVFREGASSFADVQGCGTYTYGETEDYNIRLVNPTTASRPFLLAPANNAFVNVNGPASSAATISWRPSVPFNGTAQSAVRYVWQLASRAAGDFASPLLTLTSGNNGADTSLILNFQQLDAALSGLSVAVGDTVRGIWRVRAIVGNDTLFSFQTWNIDIRRGTVTDALLAFNLLTPPNGTILPIAGPGSQRTTIRWSRAVEGNNNPVTYQWLAIAPGGNFNTPTVALASNNNGADTSLTLTFNQIDALLASLGFNVGDSVILDWTVRATSGSFTRLADQTWRVRMHRSGIAPLRATAAPVENGGTTGLRAPNGTSAHTFFRAASFVPASELAAAGIDSGETIRSFALRTSSGANIAARGKFTLYLSNGQNVAYTRGTAWTGAINGLNTHFDDSIALPTTAGVVTVQFTQPFIYNGGSIELAYEWNGAAPFATTGAVFVANTAIGSSLVSANSATTAPTTLSATAFRPEFIWGVDDRKANEVEVLALYAKGRNPRQWGTPEVIQAVVRNNGYEVRTNQTVTLTVGGANSFTNTQTIASLGIDTVRTVNFANFTPTNLGFNNMSVSIPADDVPANNSKSWVQQQTDSIFSYNDTTLTGLGGVGYNTGSGLLLTRYTINGARSIRAARIRISNTAAIIGNSLYAVVLNDSGVIVGQSATRVMTAADTSQWVVFSFANPVNVTNRSFFIGLAQTANATTGYFPMAFQAENPTRANAYYTATLTGANLAQVGGFRLMIEAHVGAPVIPVDSLSFFVLRAPSNNTVVNLEGDPTQTVNIRWNRSVRSVGTTPVTYRWLLDVPGTNFSNPVVTVNAGTDTSLTLTYGQIVDTLAARGIQVGQGFSGRWTVRAVSDTLNRLAVLPFNLTLNRGVMSSIEETEFSKSIVLYPNPAAYTAKLQVRGADKDLQITVVNAVGQEMKKLTINSGVRSEIEIDLANLNEGMYFVRISDGSNLAIKRLMIQR